ncbi:MAG: iron ABC transporter permease [Candidatus Melainabacteria bacterium]|nr:iron ABC transporter permease [Candidatus Melainabacteria bacterium]
MRLVILILVFLAVLGLGLCLGDIWLAPQETWAAMVSSADTLADRSGLSEIIWQIRLPRLLAAVVVGSSLAVSGYVLQTLSRNQLADPYLTGVSSGAGLAVAIAIIFGVAFAFVPAAAFLGGLAASLIVALMSRSPSGLSVTRLLLSGVALSAICSGLITLFLLNSGDLGRSQGLFFWLAGGLSGTTWNELCPACLYSGAGLATVLFMSKPLRLLSLGPQQAASLGLNVARTQWLLLACSVLMCGASVSLGGLVGFVGLLAPHLARRIFGRDERIHIACCVLVGAVLVLLSDLAARSFSQGQELPLGTLLCLIGGPFFLYLVSKQHGEGL